MPDDGPLPRHEALPVAVLGAGPIGLAAAAELLERGLTPLVLEAGPEVASAVRAWGHVSMFSPWRYNIAPAAARLLARAGWHAPDPDIHPTGAALVAEYLAPLASLPELAPRIRLGARVVGISRDEHDLLRDAGRDAAPFVLQFADAAGALTELRAQAVVDCTGTWASPNPAGAHGLKAVGEAGNAERIAYGIPDVLGAERAAHAGRTTLVLGAGHSAMNAVLDLVALADQAPGTNVLWAFRRELRQVNFGGGGNDALAERGALGARALALAGQGRVQVLAPFRVARFEQDGGPLRVIATDGQVARADRVIVATGFRPDLAALGELRLALDPAVQAPRALAPLIDPNQHSCGTVRPHGEAELRHPESGFYIAGMKSYGRAPTFLLATGHEQVRSIVAYLAGDLAAAREVQLDLPETGVCSTAPALAPTASAVGCCTPATPQGVCCPPKPALAAGASCCG